MLLCSLRTLTLNHSKILIKPTTVPNLISELFDPSPFSIEEEQLMMQKLTRQEINKGEHLLRPGQEVNNFYYIKEGCLRTYFIDPSGKEFTLQFGISGWWISDYIALYDKHRTQAVCFIECLKKAVIYKVSKRDFDDLCLQIPKLGHFHRSNLESAFAAFQNRILENLTLSARERYVNFIDAYPDIEQNVKNYHIASYLGITTESLSRIRKEIASE